MFKFESVLDEWFARMRRSGLSQKELSELTGLSRSYLNRILSGKANPSLSVIENIEKKIEEYELDGLNKD